MLIPPIPRPPVATAPPVLEFRGSRLGMSLDEWRGAPFPGATTDVRPVCSSDVADPSRLGLQVKASAAHPPGLACTYAFEGPSGPRAPIPISDGFYARRARYVFQDRCLSEISFSTSPNAFDAVVARIDAQMGPAKETTRDTARVFERTLPRVRMRWSGPAGVVTLVDPAGTGLLAVDYAARPSPLGVPAAQTSAARSSHTQPPG